MSPGCCPVFIAVRLATWRYLSLPSLDRWLVDLKHPLAACSECLGWGNLNNDGRKVKDMETKWCPTCKITKPVSEFSKNRCQKDNLACECKTCVKKYLKKYWKTKPGKAALRKSQKKYFKSKTGKAMLKKAKKKYSQTPAGKAADAARSAKRRALKLKQTPKNQTKEEKAAITNLYRFAQAFGYQEDGQKVMQIDHIIPLDAGGMHELSNLQMLPTEANLKKHNKLNYQVPIEPWRLKKLFAKTKKKKGV